MKIAMIGTGYVGLVSGTCFADFGFHVTCLDKDVGKIEALKTGVIPIYEPGLENLVKKNIDAGNLHFTTDLKSALHEAEAIFIAVGTPSRRGEGHADLTYVYEAIDEIAKTLTKSCVIITKSTVPVGTGREIQKRLKELRPDLEISVASNPEFLREGSAIDDFMRPDRIIAGAEDAKARDVLRALYRPLFLLETPLLFTNFETAELIKYAANGFLATKIAFINEIADLCEKVGANVQDISRGIGLDVRIGKHFLHAGPGYGGSCFPKDTLALVQTAQFHNAPMTIVESVVKGNQNRKERMVSKILEIFKDDLKNKKIAVLGVTFKPNTDDMREAPSLTIIPGLQKEGIFISAFDPVGMTEAQKQLENVEWSETVESCIQDADAVLILTEWNQFRGLNWASLSKRMRAPLLIDLRNIYKPEEINAQGLNYISVGRSDAWISSLQSEVAA
ncbi:UDP-glucose 6-dehydrogenase [Candidatus Bealeia paramacronuclearis]|uniref:UDP-glucose 6-dehydrogenase n=1 Tax=Candidatus Bealeia paramacronuclearis TaxID=1921001 RepID=A0ABZ2C7Y0_9PROT|nr:UDP-glucose 6-dehydrogenase [Candidatus Bealeia paramacronuclearis]